METGTVAALGPEELAAYAGEVAKWRGELASAAASCGADYVPMDTSTPFSVALASYLTRRAGH